jgi:hypothetical protein
MGDRFPWALKVKKGYQRDMTKELRAMTGHIPGTAKRSGISAMLESQWEYSSRVYKEECHKRGRTGSPKTKSTTFDNRASSKGKK